MPHLFAASAIKGEKNMNMVDFDYYSNIYRGSLIRHTEFKKYARKAQAYVEGLIFGREPGDRAESVKLAICNVAELLFLDDERFGISAENADGYSVSYSDGDIAGSIYNAVSIYLADSGLMYAGAGE